MPWGRVYPPAPNRHQAGKHIRLGAAWQIVLRLYAGMQIHSMRGMNHGQTRCNRRLSRFGKMGSWLLPSAKSSYALLLACVPVPHLQSRTYRRWGPVRDINIWARRFFESRKKYASGGIGHTPVGGPGNRGRGYAPPLPPSAKRRHSTGAAWHIKIPLCVNGPKPRGRAERRWGGYGPSPPRPCFDRDSGTSVVTASSRYCALRYYRQRAKPWRRMYVALQPAERPLDVLRKACGGITALVRGERPAPLPKDPVPPPVPPLSVLCRLCVIQDRA